MIWNPQTGQSVQIWYRQQLAAVMPWHGQRGTVIAAGTGRGPRNVCVRVGDELVNLPRGNLRAISIE